MEVPGLAHNISSPLSPCEGMIKDLSLDAIQLCERDGKGGLSASHWGADISPHNASALGRFVSFGVAAGMQSVCQCLSLRAVCTLIVWQ